LWRNNFLLKHCEDSLGELLKKPLKRLRAGKELGLPIEDTLKVFVILLETMMH